MVWPEGLPVPEQPQVVLLELAVDASGQVVDAAVIEGVDAAIDAAALSAIYGFRFLPARDASGQAVAARIQYALRIEPEVAPIPSVEGLVTDDEDLPLPASLLLEGPDGQTRRAVVDDDGRFVVAGLAPGAWVLRAASPGFVGEEATFEVRDGAIATLRLRLQATETVARDAQVSDTVEVVARRAPPEVGERALSAKDIRFLPGTAGDVVRAIQNLPGIARPPLGIGQLIIRGTRPEDSRYTLDGMEIPLVFHFAGLTTVLPSDVLDEVAFLPGNFSVRFGRNLGGRVDLRTQVSIPDKSNGYVQVDLYQAAAYGEFRLSERTALTLSLRRSYADAILTPILSTGSTRFQAPRYYDGLARLVHRTPGGGSLDAAVLFSDDRFQAISVDEEGTDTLSIGFSTTFVKGRMLWRAPLPGGGEHEFGLIVGPDFQRFAAGDDIALESRVAVDVREEITLPVSDKVRWRFGWDVRAGPEILRYDVSAFGPRERANTVVVAPAMFVEPTFSLGRLTLIPGLRLDLWGAVGAPMVGSIDPRIASKIKLSDTTTLRIATGRFSQFATTRQVLRSTGGTPGLPPGWSLQSAIGVDQELPFGMTLEATAFYNRLFNLPVGREDRFRFFTGPPPVGPFDTDPFAAVGRGMICGLELGWRMRWKRFTGLASITTGRSFRTLRDREAGRVPFENDQPLVLTGLGSVELPKDWRLGARVRYSSGIPYAPVSNRIYDLESRGFIPIFAERGSGRLPSFFALDLRVDKSWTFKRWELAFFLDVQNATNTRNVEVISWTYDFAQEDGVLGLPVFPVLGLRASW